MKVDILGTEYEIFEKTDDEDRFLRTCDGYCDKSSKKIVLRKFDDDPECQLENQEWYRNKVLRHEIIHGFLFERGLAENAKLNDEGIVDWIAMQFPKMKKLFEQLGISE